MTPLLRTSLLTVSDHVCEAGPDDAPFVEHHTSFQLAYVRRGSFGYRHRGSHRELVVGSLLVGHPGDEFTCTHEHHGRGDACLSIALEQEAIDELGGRADLWKKGALPPLAALIAPGENAQASASGEGSASLEECALALAARFVELASGSERRTPEASPCDRRRAVIATQFIEAHAHEPLGLERVAREVGLSTYHFLRIFSRVLGVTPHQYLLRTRLRSAARLLREREGTVTEVALRVGFADLSNFVRTFHRTFGTPPGRFRESRGCKPRPAHLEEARRGAR